MKNAVNWFEIPANDIDRAVKFYSTVLNTEFQQQEMMGTKMAFFTNDTDGVGGSICSGEGYTPSAKGAKIYLNAGEDLSEPLSRVEAAGGKVVLPKTKITDEIGYMATFIDSEGNSVSFHSPK
ncbi:MAG: VOC family protein [Ignavibacteriaceae bacterium]|jgi:predicted enzyme related to lactoylglutathione lyase